MQMPLKNLSQNPQNKTVFDLIGVNGKLLSQANFTALTKRLNITAPRIFFELFTFQDMITFLNMTEQVALQIPLIQLFQQFVSNVVRGSTAANQPVAIAAYRKGITISQLPSYTIIALAMKITGFTEIIIQKLYNMSAPDLNQAKVLTFGQLPTYVKQTMKVDSQLKHFYTMSFDSIAKAMLIHKNQTEGTIDFIKDFAKIARNVTINDIKAIYGLHDGNVTTSSLFTISNIISGINFTQFKIAMNDTSDFHLKDVSIGEMATFLSLNASEVNKFSLIGLRNKFRQAIAVRTAYSLQPVAIAAYKKGITISQLAGYTIINLAVKITGLTETFIQKLYKISPADFNQAKVLTFGQLPAYVKQTMKVDSQLKHFYTMSFDSIAKAMLIHKNQTEGTIDFIKDFAKIARNVTINDIKAIYGLHDGNVTTSSLFTISNIISGINFTQFKIAMNDTSDFHLKDVSIGEMATFLSLNASGVNKYSLIGLRHKFRQAIAVGTASSLQPVAISAYKKGITISQLAGYSIINLAVKITGLTETFIQKLYKISPADFNQAKVLTFGQLPAYVKQTMKVDSQLKHFYTMSFDSIAKAMLIHKNQTEGTIDFIKDFAKIARNVTINDIKAIYGLHDGNVTTSSLFTISNIISGINFTQFKIAMNDTSDFHLKDVGIGEMATFLSHNASELNKFSLIGLRNKFRQAIAVRTASSLQPVAIAAYKKGITISQLAGYTIINLAVKITGLTETFIQKLYKISPADFNQAKILKFGQLPAYVKQTMKVDSQLKHFYTMSFDSIAKAMLIHKNQTEGTIDFIKDFARIARNVTINDIKAIYGLHDGNVTTSSLFTISNIISGINFTQFKIAMNDTSDFHLKDVSIGEMATFLSLNASGVNKYSLIGLRHKFRQAIAVGTASSLQPVAIAAYKKGITISQLAGYTIINLAVKITGLTETFIQKLYKISPADFNQAKVLTFGQLPAYVKQTMKVDSQLKHFYTMSFDSIAKAMLIHKNQTEGTIDFIKDFAKIARNVTINDIKAIYGLHDGNVTTSSLFTISNIISGINFTQFKIAMNDTSDFHLKDVGIGEMATFLSHNASELNKFSLIGLRNKFRQAIAVRTASSLQPVAIAAYKKGITISQLAGYTIINLAVKITGLTETFIQKLYKISPADFNQAKILKFGQLPAYVKQTMKVDSQLKHFYTMSFDSIAKAMLIHKNQTEGTIDFIKDFARIARNVTINDIKAIYGLHDGNVTTSSLFTISNIISGINFTQFKIAMNDTSDFHLKDVSIGEMATFLSLNASGVNKYSLIGLRHKFRQAIAVGTASSLQPVAIAAYKKGITISQLAGYTIINLAVKITGLTETFIQKLYKISPADFNQAKVLKFGQLPAYVKQTMKVDSQLKHFYTMSFDSIAKAMLIHKNQTEGTIDFIKDFAKIARNVTIYDIKAIYGLHDGNVTTSSLFTISNIISGIYFTQFKIAMNDTSLMNLKDVNIGEMAAVANLNSLQVNNYSLIGLRDRFIKGIARGLVIAKQPIVFAAFNRGIAISQLPAMNIIRLAVRFTNFTEMMIKDLYKIPNAEFNLAKNFTFGQLPFYVKQITKVDSELKHYYTMSFDSIASALLVHKNITEGTIDFIKDFHFIASNVSMATLSKMYGFHIDLIKQKTLPEFLNLIAGTNFSVVTKFSVNEIDLLSSFTFEEGLFFLKSRLEPMILETATVNKYIQAVLGNSKIVPGFFARLDNLVSVNLMQTTLLRLINLASLSNPPVQLLLKSSLISVNYFQRIREYTLQDLFTRRVFVISPQNVGQYTLMKVLQSIRNFKGICICLLFFFSS